MMAISKQAAEALMSMGEQLGLAWQKNTRRTRSTDDVLHICIGDGIAPTKIDGWIHACTLTAKSMIKYASDPDRGLDIVGATSWNGGNSALRYARWQADFHWKIDTRPWQFFLYMFPMKWAFSQTIRDNSKISDSDRAELLQVNEDFWEEVVVAYTYRSETIERSRKFAPHPDPSCGSSWQGYPFRKIWDRDDPTFEDLAMPFLEKGKSEYERVEGKIEPKPFPALDNQIEDGLPKLAWGWIETAKEAGVSDDFLRVQLGDRIVPTRFNGWWASLNEIMRFLVPYAEGRTAGIDGARRDANGFDLSDYAVRFALCQSEFQRRLRGEAKQLVALIESSKNTLCELVKEQGLPEKAVDDFVTTANRVITKVLQESISVGETEIPELNVARPLHPRYAPIDPLEPLHWEVPDPSRYLKKMAQLGYTL
jgi:hypothetical protein